MSQGCSSCGKGTRNMNSSQNAKKLTSKTTKAGGSMRGGSSNYGVPSVKSSGFTIGRRK